MRCPSCGARNRVPRVAKGHPRCAKCHADLAWLVDAGDADFAAATVTSVLVVVDLWAPWCGPCRMVAPVLEQLAQELAGKLKVVKVNVDASPQVAHRFQARSIPMMLIMRDGRVVETVVGAQPLHTMRTIVEGHL
jgi:thioredoxin 2